MASDNLPPHPCRSCRLREACPGYRRLEDEVYRAKAFRNPGYESCLRRLLGEDEVAPALKAMTEITENWVGCLPDLKLARPEQEAALPALADYLMSGLYAARLAAGQAGVQGQAFCHHTQQEALLFFPYVWMCPACIAEGRPATSAYLPGARWQAGCAYPDHRMLSRPIGSRLTGDLGVLCLSLVLHALLGEDMHLGRGGRRGAFDLILSGEDQLVICELKTSPLVCYPLVCGADGQPHHSWSGPQAIADRDFALYLAAADGSPRQLPLGRPEGPAWPLPVLAEHVRNLQTVRELIRLYAKHLAGYRAFNCEPALTRWQRFGCGNIQTNEGQLRVDNTKQLPGLDRTDDLKKGQAQMLTAGQLKSLCRRGVIKSALVGNLYAETHHRRYLAPYLGIRAQTEDASAWYLFDCVIGLSRNHFNDPSLARLFPSLCDGTAAQLSWDL